MAIKIELIEALRKQMALCQDIKKYKCGIYVTTRYKKDVVVHVISNILSKREKEVMCMRNDSRNSKAFIEYPNGSVIKILPVNDSARGYRHNGLIIDYDTEQECVNTLILPYLTPLMSKSSDNPRDRVFYCKIDSRDATKSENISFLVRPFDAPDKNTMHYDDKSDQLFYFSEAYSRLFKKEYMCMWYSEYNNPIKTIEKNNTKILVFNAAGIPNENIKYETEFVNKTKELYLVVKGAVEMTDIDYKNEVNIREKIDTSIYEGYDVNVKDGLIFVGLHEIVNEVPVLKNYGSNVAME